jgi:hypothetical protein
MNIRFPRAYCIELDTIISVYVARDLFFSEDSEYFHKKLQFCCPDKTCRASLKQVGIYMSEKSKRVLHFSSIAINQHLCTNNQESKIKNSSTDNPIITKEVETHLPAEFLLERKKDSKNNHQEIVISESEESTILQRNTGLKNSESIKYKFKTSNLENLIDAFLNYDKSILKQEDLVIAGKKKKFFYFFKKIQYFNEETGLIYYGLIKEIKPYGQDFRITFQKPFWENKKAILFSIYIKAELINNYRKKNLFRQMLDGLKNTNEREVFCFFTGTSPQKELIKKDHIEFEVFNIDIQNLDHIAFTFDNPK